MRFFVPEAPTKFYAEPKQSAPNPDDIGDQSRLRAAGRAVGQGLTFGFGDEIAAAFRHYVAGEDYEAALADERELLDKYRAAKPYEAYGLEIGSGVAIPFGASAQLLRGAITAGKVAKGAVAVGAPTGALYEVGTAKGIETPDEYASTALAGAAKGAAGYAVAAPVVAGAVHAGRTLTRAVRDAINPDEAAVRRLARAFEDSGIEPALVRAEVAPAGKRALSDADVSDLIARRQAGESTKDIAAALNVSVDTVRKRLKEADELSSFPMNLVDATKAAADRMGRQGADEAVTDLARTAAAIGGEGRRFATEKLKSRQYEAQDRLTENLGRQVKGDFETEVARLGTVVKKQIDDGYSAARANKEPLNLRPVISKYRARGAPDGTSGEVGSTLNKAIDLFFKPAMVSRDAKRPMKYSKFGGGVVDDVERYLAARYELDQMIAKSMSSVGKGTPLTRKLTQLRQDLNAAAHGANPALKKADAKFAEGALAEKALKMGESFVPRTGPKFRATLAQFKAMSPEAQQLFRIGFIQGLQNKVQDRRVNWDVAAQFRTSGARQAVRAFFPKKDADAILRVTSNEAIGAESFRDILAGSRTTPLAVSVNKMLDDVNIVGEMATGNVPAVLKRLGTKLANQLGEERAARILRLMLDDTPGAVILNADKVSGILPRLQRVDAGQSIAGRLGGIAAAQYLARNDSPTAQF